MKRILTCLLALCLLAGLMPAALAAETESDPTAYIPVLQDVVAKNKDTMFGEAMLSDLDGAGTPELILFYLDPSANYRAVTSVYTVRDGQAVRLLKPTAIYTQVGGNGGFVATAERDGKRYFLTHSSEPEVGADTVTTEGVVKLYAMNGKKLSVKAVMEYHEELYIGDGKKSVKPYVVEERSYSVIDGARESYAAYEAVMDSITLLDWNIGFTSSEYQDDAIALKSMLNRLTTGFTDVASGKFYTKPVMWAAENGITTGTSASKFSPNATCTRAQFVTFLWRTMGSPAPKSRSNPFRDVKQGTFYYDAVLWAVEQGITTGTSAKTFSPNNTCTRAETVTFLWRLNGKPNVSATTKFRDVSKNAFYAKAVAWAVREGVTVGTSAKTFSPNASCTRGETVTFLYRNQA